jgi:hypothetical protein
VETRPRRVKEAAVNARGRAACLGALRHDGSGSFVGRDNCWEWTAERAKGLYNVVTAIWRCAMEGKHVPCYQRRFRSPQGHQDSRMAQRPHRLGRGWRKKHGLRGATWAMGSITLPGISCGDGAVPNIREIRASECHVVCASTRGVSAKPHPH